MIRTLEFVNLRTDNIILFKFQMIHSIKVLLLVVFSQRNELIIYQPSSILYDFNK